MAWLSKILGYGARLESNRDFTKSIAAAHVGFEKPPLELFALEEVNFDLSLLGFSAEDLARTMGKAVDEGLVDPDDVPEPPDEAVTQADDLWTLRRHRLLSGDSSKPEDVDRLLGGAVIRLTNSDPPYKVKVEPMSHNAIAAGPVIVHWSKATPEPRPCTSSGKVETNRQATR